MLLCVRPAVSAASPYQNSVVRDRSVVSIGWSSPEWKIDGGIYPFEPKSGGPGGKPGNPKFQLCGHQSEAVTIKSLRFPAATMNKYSTIHFVVEDQMLLRQQSDSSDAMLGVVPWIVLSVGLFLTSEIIYKYYQSPMKRKSFVDDEHSAFFQDGGMEETVWELPEDVDVVVEDNELQQNPMKRKGRGKVVS